ncbi:hypothetical protein TRIUR3_31072 [Triticum urartu]|uniref:Uncharacterized protein n=1 Tax=Triticum urartu TaxID=4572 RepID=M7YYG3_TRIUA|nr:hypothetical protein TRIUR3_31072 [Triticum urartu]
MQDGILYGNILITNDYKVATSILEKTWKPKFDVEKEKSRWLNSGTSSLPLGKNNLIRLSENQDYTHPEFLDRHEQVDYDVIFSASHGRPALPPPGLRCLALPEITAGYVATLLMARRQKQQQQQQARPEIPAPPAQKPVADDDRSEGPRTPSSPSPRTMSMTRQRRWTAKPRPACRTRKVFHAFS